MVRRAALISAVAALACDTAPTLVQPSRHVAVYAVVSPRALASPDDSSLYSMVLEQNGPFNASYLTANAFTMRRVSDNAVMDWQWVGQSGGVPSNPTNGVSSTDGNYRLDATPGPGLISRFQLSGGDSISLSVTLSDRVVQGRTRIPHFPTPTLIVAGDSVVAYWARDAHTALYYITADSENAFPSFQTDTSFTLRLDRPAANRPPTSYFRVVALDSAYARFLTDANVVSAGLTNAHGVFGSVTADSVEVPNALFPSVQASSRKP